MDLQLGQVTPCRHHEYFHKSCHACLVETVVGIIEHLSADPTDIQKAPPEASHGLMEVFDGTTVAQFMAGNITNVTALEQTADDISDGVVRYTIEVRKNVI